MVAFNSSPPDPFKLAQDAVRVAADNKGAALLEYTRLKSQLDNTSPTTGGYQDPNTGNTFGAQANPEYTRLAALVENAARMYDSATREHNDALAKLSDVAQKEVQRKDPTTLATAQAVLQKAQVDLQKSQADLAEWQSAAPDRKAEAAANIRLRNAQAAQAELDTEYQRETDPTRKAALQQQLKEAQVATDQANVALQSARTALQVQQATAGNQVIQSNQAVSAGDIANQTSQAQLETLQRNNRQAPTDEEVATARGLANQQSGANLAQTQANTGLTNAQTTRENALTAQTQLGGLADLDTFIGALKDQFTKGNVSMDDVTRQIMARIGGTDVYTASKAAADAAQQAFQTNVSQRGQDVGAVSGARSNLASMGNNALSTIAGAARFAKHGSGAALAGLHMGVLNDYTNRIGGPSAYQMPAQIQQPALPPMLQAFAGGGQPAAVQAPAAPAVSAPAPEMLAPVEAYTPPHAETSAEAQARIAAMLAAQQQQEQLPGYAYGGSFMVGGQGGTDSQTVAFRATPGEQVTIMPAFLRGRMPMHPRDVIAMNPNAARRAGLI